MKKLINYFYLILFVNLLNSCAPQRVEVEDVNFNELSREFVFSVKNSIIDNKSSAFNTSNDNDQKAAIGATYKAISNNSVILDKINFLSKNNFRIDFDNVKVNKIYLQEKEKEKQVYQLYFSIFKSSKLVGFLRAIELEKSNFALDIFVDGENDFKGFDDNLNKSLLVGLNSGKFNYFINQKAKINNCPCITYTVYLADHEKGIYRLITITECWFEPGHIIYADMLPCSNGPGAGNNPPANATPSIPAYIDTTWCQLICSCAHDEDCLPCDYCN